ncbi:hypothetical protein [Oceaniglobus trochenteri]|uniref:hypothetical protein n=1 Tax=Oceaniglobus trochenteri TaxID=2763260 RepID=UPI001CFF7EE6|nr:hypothetical protein [Oceaniglobus trochenteri]
MNEGFDQRQRRDEFATVMTPNGAIVSARVIHRAADGELTVSFQGMFPFKTRPLSIEQISMIEAAAT